MSGDFAGAVAQIAPVVLLVIVVEIAANRDRMVNGFREAGRSAALIRSMARRESLTPAQATRARRAVIDHRRHMRTVCALLLYLAISAAVAVTLLDAEWRAIGWLADPDAGPAPDDARFCARVITLAFFRIVVGPLFALLQPMVEGLVRTAPGAFSAPKLQRLLDREQNEAPRS
ncbi:hypothetical protein [Streptomyces sp. NPDC004286]|uniref:hypothetical protein n=1 Tax=Streptomyces sp. NPDC004286 TaxID=3364696 RepID=UPI003696CAF4